eukprot:gene40656-49569_t
MLLKISDEEYEQCLIDYENRLDRLHFIVLSKSKHIYTFCTLAYYTGEVLQGFLDKCLLKIQRCDADCYLYLITLVRLLYVNDQRFEQEEVQFSLRTAKERICQALSKFPFYPAVDTPHKGDANKLIFWSEHVLFMTLSSAHLFFQYYKHTLHQPPPNHSVLIEEAFHKLLEVHAHRDFGGIYEVNSSLTLPCTLCALLNLVDFSAQDAVRQRSEGVLTTLLTHLSLCTNPTNGSMVFSATTRSCRDSRHRSFGFDLNQLSNLLLGRSPDAPTPSPLADFLLTSSYRPAPAVFAALRFQGQWRGRVTPRRQDLDRLHGTASSGSGSGSALGAATPPPSVPRAPSQVVVSVTDETAAGDSREGESKESPPSPAVRRLSSNNNSAKTNAGVSHDVLAPLVWSSGLAPHPHPVFHPPGLRLSHKKQRSFQTNARRSADAGEDGGCMVAGRASLMDSIFHHVVRSL